MATAFQMVATKRNLTGKGPNRRLRAAGQIPAVLYGGGDEALTLAVSPKQLTTAISGPLKMNTLLELDVQEDGTSVGKRMALLREFQIHPLRRNLLHADFTSVALDKPLLVRIPIELTGKSKGVVAGGMIQLIRRDIGIECLPDQIPEVIKLDVTELDIGDNIHVGDVPLPEGAQTADNARYTILTCVAPLKEAAEETAEDEVGVDGEAAAAPAADDKPAESEEKKED